MQFSFSIYYDSYVLQFLRHAHNLPFSDELPDDLVKPKNKKPLYIDFTNYRQHIRNLLRFCEIDQSCLKGKQKTQTFMCLNVPCH